MKPFAKLDTTNTVSFQLINILFLHEPPDPDGTISFYQRNLVYQFAHTYKYVTSSWFLASLDSMVSSIGSEGTVLVGGGDFPTASSAVFVAEVDDTNVNFYIDKYWIASSGFDAPAILGFTVSVRGYVFINDLTGGDIPSQP
jgi:hypothetical protein